MLASHRIQSHCLIAALRQRQFQQGDAFSNSSTLRECRRYVYGVRVRWLGERVGARAFGQPAFDYFARRNRYRAGVSPVTARNTRVMYCTLANPLSRATCLIVISLIASRSFTFASRTRWISW